MAEASWGLAEAEDDRLAEAPLDHLVVPRLVSEADSEVAEEAGISLILNMGRTTRWLHSTAARDPQRVVAPHHEITPVQEHFFGLKI